jgi:hypothetical protein
METEPEAIVTKVDNHPVVEVAEGIAVSRFTVHAKICAPAHKFSAGLYLVKLIEPEGLQLLQSEQGWLMEDGIFQFDAVDDIPVNARLKIAVESAAGAGP